MASGTYDDSSEPFDDPSDTFDYFGPSGLGSGITSISYSNGFTIGSPSTPPTPTAPIYPVKGVKTWKFVLVETDGTQIAELTQAKAKQVTWPLNDAASASFTIDGRLPQAALIQETETDLIVYDKAGVKRFRGRMGSSGDDISAGGHTTSFSAVDYRGFMARKLLRGTATTTFASVDQANIAWQLLTDSMAQTGAGFTLTQGAGFPGGTGINRSFTFQLYAKIGDLLSQIANVDNGFDWDIDADLNFNVYYPQRGNSTALVLEYGSTVLKAQRTVDTSQFANVVVYTGDQSLTPVEADAASFGTAGAWEAAFGDTTILDQTTLTLKADFERDKDQQIVPSHVLTLLNQKTASLPDGWWSPEELWLGDSALVVIRSGRVNDIAQERISQVQLAIGDDGGEVVTLTTGPVSQDQAQQLDDALNRITRLETT